MIIPDRLRIGNKEYKIRFKNIVDWTDSNVSGQINYSNSKLIIKRKQDDRDIESTLFHEIAHGVLKELEFNHPKISSFRNDEVFVNEMGLTLRKTFLDLMKKQAG